MTLSARARQAADSAPRHQSAAVLRECADALDAKDAEIARLKEERQHLFTLYPQRHKDGSPCSDPDCQRAHALREWLVAASKKQYQDDQATIASLKADLAALQSPDRQVTYTEAQYVAMQEAWAKDAADLAALREAVGALPEYAHSLPCPHEDYDCICGTEAANAARAAARKLAGLE